MFKSQLVLPIIYIVTLYSSTIHIITWYMSEKHDACPKTLYLQWHCAQKQCTGIVYFHEITWNMSKKHAITMRHVQKTWYYQWYWSKAVLLAYLIKTSNYMVLPWCPKKHGISNKKYCPENCTSVVYFIKVWNCMVLTWCMSKKTWYYQWYCPKALYYCGIFNKSI